MDFTFVEFYDPDANENMARAMNVCPDCKGSGMTLNWEKGHGYELCWICNGNGKYPDIKDKNKD